MYKAPLSLIAMLLLLLSAIPAGAEIYWVDTDAYGTIVGISKEDGTRVWSGEYYPFGEQFRTPNQRIKNQRTFLGKEFEPQTGLTAVGARNYSSELGRFTSADPIGPVNPWTSETNYEYLANPLRLNRYAYGMNNPYRYVDPDGKLVQVNSRDVTYSMGIAAHTFTTVTDKYGVTRSYSSFKVGKKNKVIMNAPSDIGPQSKSITSRITIPPPKGMSQDEWDQKVKEEGQSLNLTQDQSYATLGGDGGKKSGNCNSTTRTLIERAGGKIPDSYNPPGYAPGLHEKNEIDRKN